MTTLFDDPDIVRRQQTQQLVNAAGGPAQGSIGTGIGLGLARLFGRELPEVQAAQDKQEIMENILNSTGEDGNPIQFGTLEFYQNASKKLATGGYLKEAYKVNEIISNMAASASEEKDKKLAREKTREDIDKLKEETEDFWRRENGKIVRRTVQRGGAEWQSLVNSPDWIGGKPSDAQLKPKDIQSFINKKTNERSDAVVGTPAYDALVQDKDQIATTTPSGTDFKAEEKKEIKTRNYWKRLPNGKIVRESVEQGSDKDKRLLNSGTWTVGNAPTDGKGTAGKGFQNFYNPRLDKNKQVEEGTREHARLLESSNWVATSQPTIEQLKSDKASTPSLETKNYWKTLDDGSIDRQTVYKGSDEERRLLLDQYIGGEPGKPDAPVKPTSENLVNANTGETRAFVVGEPAWMDAVNSGDWSKTSTAAVEQKTQNYIHTETGKQKAVRVGSPEEDKLLATGKYAKSGDAVVEPGIEYTGTVAKGAIDTANAIRSVVNFNLPVPRINHQSVEIIDDATDKKIKEAPEGLVANIQEMLQKEIKDSNQYINFGKDLLKPQFIDQSGETKSLLEIASNPGMITDIRRWFVGAENQVVELFESFGQEVPAGFFKEEGQVNIDDVARMVYNTAALAYARLEFGAVYRGGGGGKITGKDVEESRNILGVEPEGTLTGSKDRFLLSFQHSMATATRRLNTSKRDLQAPRKKYNRENLEQHADENNASIIWKRYPKSIAFTVTLPETAMRGPIEKQVTHSHPKAGQQVAEITYPNKKTIRIDADLQDATRVTANARRQYAARYR